MHNEPYSLITNQKSLKVKILSRKRRFYMDKLTLSDEDENRTIQSGERLLALIKASSDVIYRMSPDWKIMTELYGHGFLTDTEVPDPDWLDKYIHPDDQKFVTEVIEECIKDKKIFELEHRVLKAAGSVGWTFSRAIPLLNEKGEIKEWFGAANDITERKRMEEETLELIDGFTEGSWIVDRISKTIRCSEKWARRIGLDKVPEKERLSYTHTLILPEDATGGNSIEHCMEARMARFDLEYRVKTVDSGYIWTQNRGKIVYDGQGSAIKVYAATIDITERKKLEDSLKARTEELEDKEREYLEIIDSSSEGSFINDLIKEEIYFSSEWKNRLGISQLSPAQAAKVFLSLAHPDDVEGMKKAYDEACKRRLPKVRMEFRIKTDAGYIWILGQAKIIYDEEGKKAIKYYGTHMDITMRKQAEEALQNERQRLFNVLESLPVMVCLITPDYHITFANKAFREKYGEAKGRHCYECCCGYTEPCAFCESLIPLKTGQAHHWEFIHPNGNTVIDAYDFPFSDTDGSPLVLEMNIDITERKQAEKALRDSEERMRALVNSMPDEVWYANKEKMVTLVNPVVLREFGEASHGDSVEKIASSFEVSRPDGSPRPVEEAPPLRALSGEVVRNQEEIVRIPARDELRYRQVNASPMIDASGNIIGSVSIARDITDQKRAEALLLESEEKARALVKELEKADRNKNAFLSTLSHELRNPLAVISAGLELLSITQDKEQLKRAKDIMSRQMSQLCALVDDLLDLTRISNNKIELKKEKIELNELALLIAEDQRALFDGKKIKLHTRTGADSIYLDADPVRIKQIIGNLLHNAQKYTQTGGETILSVYKESKEAVISVKDNGIGLSPELKPRLFQPFVQADMSLNRSGGGLGLGLSITKGIVELHGGSVSVYSEGLGKGSEFIIRLPLSDMMGYDNADGTKQINAGTHSLKILVIEDNRDFADLLRAMLTVIGYQVMVSYDGHKGVEKAKQFKPDTIFCDIGLPGMNGFEVAKLIKKDDDLKGALLVALTGYVGEDDLKRAKESGFDRHMAKPVSLAAMQQFLNEIIH